MKILIVLALVALSTALPAFSGNKLTYGEDGTIILNGGNGYELNIFSSVTKPRTLDIVIKAPGVATRALQVDEASNIKEVDLKNVFGNKFNSYQDFNQLVALRAILKQFEGNLDETSYYSLLNRIQLLVEAGVFKQSLLDVLRDWDLTSRRQHQVSDVLPEQELAQHESSKFQGAHSEDEEHGIQGQWNINQELWSPIERYQALLQQIRLHRQFQQGQLKDYHYPQQDRKYRNNWAPEFTQGQQYFVEQSENEASEENTFEKRLQAWFTQQKLVNHQIEQTEHPSQELVQDTINKQTLLNQQAERFIQYLVYQQARITYNIESLIEQGQIASSELVNRQRIIYKQVHQLIEKLTNQQYFFDQKIQENLQQSLYVHPQYFAQHKILSAQVYQLIQQVYFQHIHIKQQIQFFSQHEDVLSQELIAIERLTYQQVEQFIPVLIQQLMYQQALLRNLMVLANREGENIPEVTINRYYNFYRLQHQLTLQGDFVPKQLYYQQKQLHQQIVQLIKENRMTQQTREVSQGLTSHWALRPVEQQAYNVLPQWQYQQEQGQYWQRNFLPQQEQQLNFLRQQQDEEQHQLEQQWNLFALQKQHQQQYQPTQQLNSLHQIWNLLPEQEQQQRDVLPADNIYQRYPIVY